MVKMQKKILWVDDDIQGLGVYVDALKKVGFQVTIADSGSKAIELVKAEEYDIALVDILMPPPDGIEILRQIYAIRPSTLLAALSSYLYLDRYRDELRELGFAVELIDKDLTNVEAPDFQMRFLKPIKELAKSGVKRTIARQEEILSKEPGVNPFRIPLTEFMAKSLLEKDKLVQEAKRLAAPAMKRAFDEGRIWVLFCGSRRQIRASASDHNEILNEDQIMEFARIQRRAPFQFFKPIGVEDMWCTCGGRDSLKDYPTLTLEVKNRTIDVHFDTGAPCTFFSYEELLALGGIRPTTLFGPAACNNKSYYAAPLKIRAVLKCRVTGQTKEVRIIGQAVRDWLRGPFSRFCHDQCEHPDNEVAGEEKKPCPLRRALVGRNLLIDNQIVLVLDGLNRVTRLEK